MTTSYPDFPDAACVGMHFRGDHAKTYAKEMPVGTTLLVEREPENAYDSNAIKLLVWEEEPWHLGYLDRNTASWAAYYVDELAANQLGAYHFMVEDISIDRGNPIVKGTLKFVPAETLEAESHAHAEA